MRANSGFPNVWSACAWATKLDWLVRMRGVVVSTDFGGDSEVYLYCFLLWDVSKNVNDTAYGDSDRLDVCFRCLQSGHAGNVTRPVALHTSAADVGVSEFRHDQGTAIKS